VTVASDYFRSSSRAGGKSVSTGVSFIPMQMAAFHLHYLSTLFENMHGYLAAAKVGSRACGRTKVVSVATFSQKHRWWREFNPSFGLPLYKSTSACSPVTIMSFGVDYGALNYLGLHLKMFTRLKFLKRNTFVLNPYSCDVMTHPSIACKSRMLYISGPSFLLTVQMFHIQSFLVPFVGTGLKYML